MYSYGLSFSNFGTRFGYKQASYGRIQDTNIEFIICKEHGEIIEPAKNSDWLVFVSYNSVVGFSDGEFFYECPRAHYSSTTSRQITQFCNKFNLERKNGVWQFGYKRNNKSVIFDY